MASRGRTLRVLDLGTVDALRSQTTWHALGHGAPRPDEVTLSFVRTSDPYVCLGRHRSLDEVDADVLERHGLPVFRRMVGGGPVYLDSDQLFFQVSLPAIDVPARRDRALAALLAPAVSALRRCGVDAVLDDLGEISVGRAKVCGHGAGQIEGMVVVVGNLILDFDHGRAAQVLRTESPATTGELERLMRRYVHPTPVDADLWREALVSEYAAALDAAPEPGRMRPDEARELDRLDALLTSGQWTRSVRRPARDVRTLKVRAGVWVHEWAHEHGCVVLSVADGRVDRVVAVGSDDAYHALVGAPLAQARDMLSRQDVGPLAAALAAAPMGGVSS